MLTTPILSHPSLFLPPFNLPSLPPLLLPPSLPFLSPPPLPPPPPSPFPAPPSPPSFALLFRNFSHHVLFPTPDWPLDRCLNPRGVRRPDSGVSLLLYHGHLLPSLSLASLSPLSYSPSAYLPLSLPLLCLLSSFSLFPCLPPSFSHSPFADLPLSFPLSPSTSLFLFLSLCLPPSPMPTFLSLSLCLSYSFLSLPQPTSFILSLSFAYFLLSPSAYRTVSNPLLLVLLLLFLLSTHLLSAYVCFSIFQSLNMRV